MRGWFSARCLNPVGFMVTWILVAHRAGARVFASRGPHAALRKVLSIPYPTGRAHTRDLRSDKPGRLFQLGRCARSSTESVHGSSDHLAEVFALELARVLNDGRNHESYDNLILLAEPRFLGKLRKRLAKATAAKVLATLAKDLGWIEDVDLPRYLKGAVLDWERGLVFST